MRTKLIAIAVAAAFPLGAYAQMTNQQGQQQQRPGASSPAEPRGGSTTQGSGTAQPGMSRLDMNRDGLISREEAKGSPDLNARFNELDRNRDGMLSPDELANASSPQGQGSSGTSGSAPMKRQQ